MKSKYTCILLSLERHKGSRCWTGLGHSLLLTDLLCQEHEALGPEVEAVQLHWLGAEATEAPHAILGSHHIHLQGSDVM